MIRGILLSVLLLCLPAWAQAATYYINDAGSNANAGTSTGAPWLTWAYAFSHSDCGDRLIVMDGTYTKATHGDFSLKKVCTVGTVYTVIAQNERAAFINSDGTQGLSVLNSAYITVEGIRIKSADEIVATANANVEARDSNHITFRRLLVTHNNRYHNTHLLQLTRSPFSLVEESEFYFFHRHAILSYYSNDSVIRRNYCHARAYADIAGGWVSAPPNTGDDCVVVYPGSRNIVENNIAEGSMLKMGSVQATASSVGNKFFGNISKDTFVGMTLDARGNTADLMPRDTLIRDFVVINTTDGGVRSYGAKNTHCDHCYVFSSGGGEAFSATFQVGVEGDGVYSFFADNSMANANTGYGFRINTAMGTWTIRTSNSFGNTINYTTATSTNYSPNPPRAVDPVMGTCRVWVPDGSPMKRAGFDGSDIGANILYRYKNGVLTNVPLWNRETGEFPHGALVAGVNDVAGKSLFDVHKRLNVNTNGCSFPANYGAGGTDVDAPDSPTNLAVF